MTIITQTAFATLTAPWSSFALAPSPYQTRINKRHRLGGVMTWIVVLVFCWSNGASLRLFQFDSHYINALRLAAVFMIVAGSLLVFHRRTWRIIIRSYYFRAILALLAVIMVPTWCTGVLRYGQDASEVIRLPMIYYALFVYLLLHFLARQNNRIMPVLHAYVSTIIGIAIIYVIASFFSERAAEWFVESVDIGSRFGQQRLTASAAVNNSMVFAAIYLVTRLALGQQHWRTRLLTGVGLGIILYYLTFVLISRTRLLAMAACLLIFFFRYVPLRRLLLPGIIAIGMLCAAQFTLHHTPLDILARSTQSISSLDRNEERDTLTIRIEGFQYYLRQFIDSGYIGIGLVSRTRGEDTDVGYALTQLGYNPSDLGIFAVLLFFGIPGVLVTLHIIVRMLRDTRSIARHGSGDARIVAVSIRYYMLFCLLSLYHVFLYEEYALEWGILFFVVSQLHQSVTTARWQPIDITTHSAAVATIDAEGFANDL